MDAENLARFQFAFTIAFHYLFPPLSIGLGLILVIMEGLYLRTGKEAYKRMTHFWVKIFALIFGIGVASGIVLEFQFGTNWATYSRYVGDIFGSALAAEGVFAFFLESGFLAILVFGWNRVNHKIHFLSTILVALGAHFSAVWIIVANSWMQTPTGYAISEDGSRAVITDFWAMVFNPSSMDRLMHAVIGGWMTAAFFVMSVSAYYLLKNRHLDMAKTSLRIGLSVGLVASLLQILVGHRSVEYVAQHQPEKMAAMEGHYETGPLSLYTLGWVDTGQKRVSGVGIPGMGSFLLFGDSTRPVKGLNDFPTDELPPIQATFQTYHLMVGLGFLMAGLVTLSTIMWRRGTLWTSRPMLSILVGAVVAPQIANQVGWATAEIGRQPWIVYKLLRTNDAISKTVRSEQIMISLALFMIVYAGLFVLFLYLLDRKIKDGPEDTATPPDDDVLLDSPSRGRLPEVTA